MTRAYRIARAATVLLMLASVPFAIAEKVHQYRAAQAAGVIP